MDCTFERGKASHFAIILVVGLLLLLPSIWSGFLGDDFFYLGAINGDFADLDLGKDLFVFFQGDEEVTARIAEKGAHPWWVYEGVKIAFCRPLAELALRTDHALFGDSPVGYHLHSLVWWLATLLAAGLLLRRGLPGAIGTLAVLLFALEEAGALPASWISNRHALISLAPVLLGLWAHIRWREEGWRAGPFLAGAGIVLGLLGGEIGLVALAYFAAYELWGAPPDRSRSRLVALAPVAALGTAYVIAYQLLGYGATGSGLYFDPVREPGAFLTAAGSGIPTLLAGGIAGLSVDLWFYAPALRTTLIAVGVAATFALLILLRAIWSGLDEPVRRGLRWLSAGSALALVPATTVIPSNRMLLVPAVGLSAPLAVILMQAWRSWRSRRGRRWRLIVPGALLAVIHLLLAPLNVLLIQAVIIKQSRAALEVAASPLLHEARDKHAVIIFAPDYIVGLYMPLLVNHLEGRFHKGWRPLSIAPYDHLLRRTAPRTLELEVAEGGVLLRSIFEELFRDPRHPLLPGTIVDRGLIRAEILDGSHSGPTRVAFHFDRDLDDPSLLFLIWMEGELRRAKLPPLGEEMYIDRTLGPLGF